MQKNKKVFIFLMAVIMGISATILLVSPHTAMAEPGPVTIIIDGRNFQPPDALPFIANDRVMVPFRPIAEALGASANWEGSTQRVTVALGNRHLEFFINGTVMNLTTTDSFGAPVRTAVPLDSPAVLVNNNRAFVPTRALSEGLGATVQWVEATRTVHITSNVPRVSPTPWPIPTRPANLATPSPIPRTPTRTPTPTVTITPTRTITPTPWRDWRDGRDLRGRLFREARKSEVLDMYDFDERFVLLFFDSRRNDLNHDRMDNAIRAVEDANLTIYFMDDAFQNDFMWFGERFFAPNDIPNPAMFFVERGQVRDSETRFTNIPGVADRIYWHLR